MTETVTVNVYGAYHEPIASARVKAELRHGNITTHGSGSPNITNYEVTIAGHELRGTWDDDARHSTQVSIKSDHPLAVAIGLIGAEQEALRNLREMRGPTPAGWRADEWKEAIYDAKHAHAKAKRAVEENATATSLISDAVVAE